MEDAVSSKLKTLDYKPFGLSYLTHVLKMIMGAYFMHLSTLWIQHRLILERGINRIENDWSIDGHCSPLPWPTDAAYLDEKL